ncbi:MAG: ABC transporter permease [Pseudomonadota bacterium]|nr:ABC transporter permease [Pseudomonadota bacterium]
MSLPETFRAAFVVGRRDFIATVFSKTFLLFLIGPLFPVVMAVAFGGIGQRIDSSRAAPQVAVIASPADYQALVAARERLSPLAQDRPFIALGRADPRPDLAAQRDALLNDKKVERVGVLDGGLDRPHFTGAVKADGNSVRQIGMFVDEARRIRAGSPLPRGAAMQVTLTKTSSSSVAFGQQIVARGGQTILFVLTILLAGMLLSQLIEEKSNKVIEILAAAVPIDAIFLGKLFAMLAMSLVGIAVWTSVGAIAIAYWVGGGLGALPVPALGWPMFLALILVYFSMSYLLIGAVFLGIGGQAATVREVQTLSMPVTMAQVVIFGLASLAVGQPDGREAIAAAIFPLSSPYAMIARAAEQDALWPHLVALVWQAVWAALILKFAAAMFRASVLKSGPSRRWPWQRKVA